MAKTPSIDSNGNFTEIDTLESNLASLVSSFNFQNGTTYTLETTDRGKTIVITNAGAITLTLPNNFPQGFSCAVRQGGVGQVTWSAQVGATVTNADGHTKTEKQNVLVFFTVQLNSNGNNATWIVDGRTAA